MSGKYQPHTQALELLQRRSSATAAQEGSEKVGSIRVVDAHVSYATISVFTKLCRCQKCMIVQIHDSTIHIQNSTMHRFIEQ